MNKCCYHRGRISSGQVMKSKKNGHDTRGESPYPEFTLNQVSSNLRATASRGALVPSSDGSPSRRRSSERHSSLCSDCWKVATTSGKSHNGPSIGNVRSCTSPLKAVCHCTIRSNRVFLTHALYIRDVEVSSPVVNHIGARKASRSCFWLLS